MSVAETQKLSSLILPNVESKLFPIKIYVARTSSFPTFTGSF